LIYDILDLSKIEADRMSVEFADCCLRQVVDDVLKVVHVRVREKALSLEVDYAPSLPEVIHTDPTKLRQILLNLVGNAIKFTEQGGVRIAIHDGPSRRGSAQIRFVISDTGIGIASDKLDELFQSFTQADASMTRRFGGTGLGLAISKRLAGLLGGDIQVDSELGRGSTFTLTIDVGAVKAAGTPAQPVVSDSEDVPRAEAAEQTGRRVLLAEDAADLQGLLSQVLRGMNLQIELAGDGRSACQRALQCCAEGRPFDLILMDVQMPQRDGLEATRWLRSRGWRGPIIALTAHAMAGDREKCLAAGCDDYLPKTVSLPELRATVARHLGRKALDAGE
jgi:CheY-like chemotaxis protein